MNIKLNSYLKVLVAIVILYVAFLVFPYVHNVLYMVKELLMPFFVGFIVAFVFHPIVDHFEKYKLPRIFALFLVLILFGSSLLLLVLNLYPIVVSQLQELIDSFPSTIDTIQINVNKFATNFSFLPVALTPTFVNITSMLSDAMSGTDLQELVAHVLQDSLELIIITPMFTLYLLYDYNNIRRKMGHLLIKYDKNNIRLFLLDVEEKLGHYFRGLIFVMLIVVVISSVGFKIVGLPYVITFGVIIAITNVIPIIGSYLGGSIAAIYALSIDSKLMIGVIIVVVVVQLIESNFLTPIIQSKSVSIHPITIIFSFSVFGFLFGFLGVFFSIPLLLLTKSVYFHFILKGQD